MKKYNKLASGRVDENSEEGKAIYDELMTLTK